MTSKETTEKVSKKKYEHILFPGIIAVSGMPDTGKTTFALECGAPPSKICFIDDDVKGKSTALELENSDNPFGMFVNLTEETDGMLETEFHKYVLDLIDSIKEGKFEVIIFDNFSRFEASFQPWVLTHQKDFRRNWSPMGQIHGAEIWLESFDYESIILDKMQKKAPLIILTSHMKKENVNGRYTGKWIPKVKTPIIQKSLFRVILRRSDDGSPVPTGIILKRISKKTVTDKGIRVINIMPTKIPHLDWDKIREYYNNPVGDRPPTPEEVLTDHEMALLDSSVLTEDQKMVMKFAMEAAKQDEEEEGEERLRSQMQEMKKEGLSYSQIAESFDTEVGTVVKILSKKD